MTKREQVQRGRRMRTLREGAGIRLEQMAANLEVTARTIENWESGTTKASKADMLAYEHFINEALCRQGLPPSNWDHVYESDEPQLPFPDGSAVVVDLREHALAQIAQKDSQDLYAIAN